jgi:MFS family permease
MNPISNMKRQPWYKWVIVAICFLMVMICLGFCSGIKSLYLSAITEALGIKRSLFSFNDSSRYVTTAVINLFFGTLVLRMGPRKMIAIGFASLIASMLVYSFAESIYIFCIGGVLLGLGLAFTTTTMVGYVVNHWCKENRGTIMGAILAANGLGGAIAAQVVSPIINSRTMGPLNI